MITVESELNKLIYFKFGCLLIRRSQIGQIYWLTFWSSKQPACRGAPGAAACNIWI